MQTLTPRTRVAVIVVIAGALVALALFSVSKLILSNDALLLDHVSESRAPLIEIAL